MEFIVCEEPGVFAIKAKDAPLKKEGEALVKIKNVGICGTDLHAYQGNQAFFTYPRILGHELAGEIIDIDANEQGLKKGDRVGIMPYVSCGTCVSCRQGKTNCCTSLQVLGVHTDGGMQEVISIPTALLLPANHLEWVEIAIMEPLAISAHAIRRSQLTASDTVIVMGCGPIGIGIMAFALAEGAKVIAMDVNADRLAYVQGAIGVHHAINALDKDVLEQIQALTAGDLANVVFDATGSKQALENGVNFMAHGGRFVLVGLFKGDLSFYHPFIHARETTLICSRNATLQDFNYVMGKLEQKVFPVNSFVTHTVPFLSMPAHFDSWLKPETGVIKAMLEL